MPTSKRVVNNDAADGAADLFAIRDAVDRAMGRRDHAQARHHAVQAAALPGGPALRDLLVAEVLLEEGEDAGRGQAEELLRRSRTGLVRWSRDWPDRLAAVELRSRHSALTATALVRRVEEGDHTTMHRIDWWVTRSLREAGGHPAVLPGAYLAAARIKAEESTRLGMWGTYTGSFVVRAIHALSPGVTPAPRETALLAVIWYADVCFRAQEFAASLLLDSYLLALLRQPGRGAALRSLAPMRRTLEERVRAAIGTRPSLIHLGLEHAGEIVHALWCLEERLR